MQARRTHITDRLSYCETLFKERRRPGNRTRREEWGCARDGTVGVAHYTMRPEVSLQTCWIGVNARKARGPSKRLIPCRNKCFFEIPVLRQWMGLDLSYRIRVWSDYARRACHDWRHHACGSLQAPGDSSQAQTYIPPTRISLASPKLPRAFLGVLHLCRSYLLQNFFLSTGFDNFIGIAILSCLWRA